MYAWIQWAIAAFVLMPERTKNAHGFQPLHNLLNWRRRGSKRTRLNAMRRPQRPAVIEKARAERKAIIQARQNQALQDPTLLTSLSFSDCKNIHPNSKRALVEDMGLQTMTEVQAKTFAAALAGKDILVRARTGTGKTLAFLVPSVETILSNPTFVPGKTVGCLVIAPTRELAIQIGNEAEKLLLHHSDLSVQVMYGGTKMARDMNAFDRYLPAILIATPGRLLDHLQSTKVRGRKFHDDIMAKTDIVVLDEIDRLLGMGFRREIHKILSYLPRKEKRQTMLFSATIPRYMKRIMEACMRDDYFEMDCVRYGVETTPTNLRVTQRYTIIPTMDSVVPSIYFIIKEVTSKKPSKVVVFLPTARMVSFFADFLKDGFECPLIELHSKKSQSSRKTASESFRKAKDAILFTSDISARGIDYPDITHVIQIGIPESRDQYIHRLGRTARAGKEGRGLLVLLPFESPFLSELRDLNVSPDRGAAKILQQSPESDLPEWMAHNFSRIRSNGNRLASSAQLAYLAFLGYYVGHASRLHSDRDSVVRLAKEFSLSIGLPHVPAIPKKLLAKMDLIGVTGVFIEDSENL